MVLTLGFSDVLEHVLPYRYFGIPVNILGWHLMFWFTNYTVMMLIASIGMLIIFPKFFGKVYTDAPTGWKNVFEYMLEFMREDVLRPVLKDHTDEFLPFLWTLFFFIMFCNFLGLLPLAQVIGLATGGHLQHMGGSPTMRLHHDRDAGVHRLHLHPSPGSLSAQQKAAHRNLRA